MWHGKTFSMRDKDSAAYRPFPDPELLPIVLTDEYINNIKNNLPELPASRRKRYVDEYKLPEYDAGVITASKYLADLFETATKRCNNPKATSNWIMSDISKIMNEKQMEASDIPFTGEQLGELVIIIEKGTISSAIGKKVLVELFERPDSPEAIVKEKGWVQIADEEAIKAVVLEVLSQNPKSVEDYKAGKDKALGFLVGQAMKKTQGKANPGILNKLFIEELKK